MQNTCIFNWWCSKQFTFLAVNLYIMMKDAWMHDAMLKETSQGYLPVNSKRQCRNELYRAQNSTEFSHIPHKEAMLIFRSRIAFSALKFRFFLQIFQTVYVLVHTFLVFWVSPLSDGCHDVHWSTDSVGRPQPRSISAIDFWSFRLHFVNTAFF